MCESTAKTSWLQFLEWEVSFAVSPISVVKFNIPELLCKHIISSFHIPIPRYINMKWLQIRVIHEKSNVKCLTSSSLILFILVIKYTMQNYSNFEKGLEGATGVLNFVHKVNRIFWSFLFRGPNMMMINLNVAKKLLDMCVLMLQNQWKKKKQKNLSQFWENHNLWISLQLMQSNSWNSQNKVHFTLANSLVM